MIHTATYAQPLRAIGQTLEVLHVEAFEIESQGDNYLVRGRIEGPALEKAMPQEVKESSLRVVWGKLRGRSPEPSGPSQLPPSSMGFHLRYSSEDIDRMEQEGQARRRDPHGALDPYSVSQLLRAVGAYVDHKAARLLGLSWRDQSVSLVYEAAQGRRELEVLRLFSVYDFWVRMSVRRSKRNPS